MFTLYEYWESYTLINAVQYVSALKEAAAAATAESRKCD